MTEWQKNMYCKPKETEKIMLLHSERINIVARYQNAGIEERPGGESSVSEAMPAREELL